MQWRAWLTVTLDEDGTAGRPEPAATEERSARQAGSGGGWVACREVTSSARVACTERFW